MKWLWGHRATVAFFGFVLALAVLFQRQEVTTRRVDNESRTRDYVACIQRNKAKDSVRKFARDLVALKPPHNPSEDLPFLRVTYSNFAPERCTK